MSVACDRLHTLLKELKRFQYPFIESTIPKNGIYILYEQGEFGHGGDRIVRVGTHTGNNQLQSRLQQHFVKENKDRSIFRKNIGRALLKRDDDPFLTDWDLDLTTKVAKDKFFGKVDLLKQKVIEQQVTEYIRKYFSFVVIEVPKKEDRLDFEARMISTVSQCRDCRPSSRWLGNDSPKSKIKQSGLWQINELYGETLSDSYFAAINESLSLNGQEMALMICLH